MIGKKLKLLASRDDFGCHEIFDYHPIPLMQKTFFALVLMITIYWASSQSMGGKPPSIHIPDKWAHLLLYGLLATLYLRQPIFLRAGAKGIIWAIALASLYGASDEFHQKFVEGRYADVVDWIADTLGAIVAATLYYLWIPYRKILEFPLLPKKINASRPSDIKCPKKK
mgnify:CR=1 FL=1